MMASLAQLVGGCQAGGTGPNHGHLLIRAHRRDAGLHISLSKACLYNEELIVADGDRIVVHAAHTGLFAQSRADSPGKFREAAGLAQAGEGLGVVAVEYLVVPLRDQIVERAACHHALQLQCRLAEGDAAVHASGPLEPSFLRGKRGVKFIEIPDALLRSTGRIIHSFIF